MIRKANSNFRQGSGKYTCVDCGKETRDTGHGEGPLRLCKRCMEIGEWLNSIYDGSDIDDVPEDIRFEVANQTDLILTEGDLTVDMYNQVKQAAIDWQYLTILGGGMARKSDLEDWLTARYSVDRSVGHTIANSITEEARRFVISGDQVIWLEAAAGRPAPTMASYPDLKVTPFGNH